ncbi:MAG: Hsp20/alpha crystallin family protein [Phycisphaerales bacterium]|jgi:HSP20 family protein|nr:Hsp20/alpha crystallin family protein [Phycisphaerales bacterium]
MNTRTILAPANYAIDSIRHELDRIYDHMAVPGLASRWPGRMLNTLRPHPAFNLLEDDDNLFIEAEMPGVSPDALEVNATDHSITVAGTRTLDAPTDGISIRRERSNVRFERTVSLPVAVEPDGIEASLVGGVLTVTLPKVRPARTRRINVRES